MTAATEERRDARRMAFAAKNARRRAGRRAYPARGRNNERPREYAFARLFRRECGGAFGRSARSTFDDLAIGTGADPKVWPELDPALRLHPIAGEAAS